MNGGLNRNRQRKGAAFHARDLARPNPAVMQQRAEAPDSLDYFPTPPWAVRAICETLQGELGEDLSNQVVWEPAAGEGFMERALAEYFGVNLASDVHDYGQCHTLIDFLDATARAEVGTVDWVITNPPFLKAAEFVAAARTIASRGVGMFVRAAFTEGDERYRELFAPELRPALVVTFCERVVLLRGRLIRANAPDPFNVDEDTGEPRKASTATAYSLVVWLPGQHDTRHRWIPKCRERLERDGDYPAYEEQWQVLADFQQLLALSRGEDRLL